MTVGLLLLSRLQVDTSLWVISAEMVLLGLGLGCVMQVLVLAVQNAVDRRDLGVATSSTAFFRTLGGACGTAIFGGEAGGPPPPGSVDPAVQASADLA